METFVVRIWQPERGEPGAGEDIRGIVEHVGSGEATSFVGVRALEVFLAETRRRVRVGEEES